MSEHPLSDGPLPFGSIWYGQRYYNEFACSKSTVAWLQGGAMTHLDGEEVTLQIKDECVGGHNVWVEIRKNSEAARAAEREKLRERGFSLANEPQETVPWR